MTICSMGLRSFCLVVGWFVGKLIGIGMGVAVVFLTNSAHADAAARPMKIGWAEVDITPPDKVALVGQHYIRIADPVEAHDPLTATALAITSGVVSSKDGSERQAVLVSVDLVGAYDLGLRLSKYFEEHASAPAGLDLDRVIIFATHTHTAPYLSNKQGIPDDVSNGDDYRAFLIPRLAELVANAWKARQPGAVGWARGEAAIGFNRIAVYRDGRAKMYGDTSTADFLEMEDSHDHGVELLYTWDGSGVLTGVIVNVANPAQVLESKRFISADYWHEVRHQIRQQPTLGKDLFVLPMCGAAGDQSPRDLQDPALTRDETHGHDGTRAIGRRLADAVTSTLPKASRTRTDQPVVRHTIHRFDLPRKAEHGDEPFPVTLHALRLGDVAIVDNPFELYLAYGLKIQQRSPAAQTFIAQLASGPAYGMYLPTEESLRGGAYGSRPENGQVGPEGGEILVERTLDAIQSLFENQHKP